LRPHLSPRITPNLRFSLLCGHTSTRLRCSPSDVHSDAEASPAEAARLDCYGLTLPRCGSASPGARRMCGCTDPTDGHEAWSPCLAQCQGVGWLPHEEIIRPVSPSCGSCCCLFTFVVPPACAHTQGSAHVRHPPGEDRSPSGPACTQDPGRTSAASSVTGKTLPCTPLHKSSRSFGTSARALHQPGEVSAFPRSNGTQSTRHRTLPSLVTR